MLRRYAASEQLITIILLIAIVLFGIKIVQQYLPKPLAPKIEFTCAVAVHALEGELCINGPSGATVTIDVYYCDGTQVSSPPLHEQETGDYRWVWHVEASCRGPAQATAIAIWPGNERAEAIATFPIV